MRKGIAFWAVIGVISIADMCVMTNSAFSWYDIHCCRLTADARSELNGGVNIEQGLTVSDGGLRVVGRSELNGGVNVEQGLEVSDGIFISHVRSELNGGVNVEQGLKVSDGGFGVVGRSELNGGVNVEQGLTVSDGPLGTIGQVDGPSYHKMIDVGRTLEVWSDRLGIPLEYLQTIH